MSLFVCLLHRRRDCLHKFMVILCERGETQELIEYPYINLEDEVHEPFNPLSSGIKLQILLLCFHTFLTEVAGRSC